MYLPVAHARCEPVAGPDRGANAHPGADPRAHAVLQQRLGSGAGGADPTQVAGNTVQIPAITEFGITPGDIGEVYGEVGLRFRALQLAYISKPRLSLYAMRMDPPLIRTADLEAFLAAAGEDVGIAGLHREPWKLQTVLGHVVWVRPEDNATLPGTHVYTWVADDLVFLMIGVNDAQNMGMLAGLPGEAPPTPTPVPSPSGASSTLPSPS